MEQVLVKWLTTRFIKKQNLFNNEGIAVPHKNAIVLDGLLFTMQQRDSINTTKRSFHSVNMNDTVRRITQKKSKFT